MDALRAGSVFLHHELCVIPRNGGGGRFSSQRSFISSSQSGSGLLQGTIRRLWWTSAERQTVKGGDENCNSAVTARPFRLSRTRSDAISRSFRRPAQRLPGPRNPPLRDSSHCHG